MGGIAAEETKVTFDNLLSKFLGDFSCQRVILADPFGEPLIVVVDKYPPNPGAWWLLSDYDAH